MLDYLILLTVLPLLGVSFGKSESSQQSQQESGLRPWQREVLGNIGVDWTNRVLGPEVSRRATEPGPQLPALTSSGLYPQQQSLYETGFSQAVRQALGGFSGQYAQQGMLNPQHVDAVAGSAARLVAPQFAQMALPVAGQNILQGLLAPENIQQQRLNQFLDLIRTVLGAPGGTGQGSGSASGFNVGILSNLQQLPGGAGK